MSDCMREKSFDQQDIRDQLDLIDQEIMKLLVQRMSMAAAMADAKKGTTLPLFDYSREQDILKKLPGCCKAPAEKQSRICSAGIKVYEEILRQSRRIQAKALLPHIIFITGMDQKQDLEICAALGNLIDFEVFEADCHLLDRNQRELIVYCGPTTHPCEQTGLHLHHTSACVFLNRSKDQTLEQDKSFSDSYTLTIDQQTPLEAAELITDILRKGC